jgi:diaminopimelate epimerase
MIIPFTKAHGAHNDFLLTRQRNMPSDALRLVEIARAICDRHTGIGADGWLLVEERNGKEADAVIRLWNSDGSTSPISGNGTRCAAAFLIDESNIDESNINESHGIDAGRGNDVIRIETGAGVKDLRLLEHDGHAFVFEMNMGRVSIDELHATVQAGYDAVILDVGNPQCAVFVDNFDFGWQSAGALIERDPRFPDRTNVSFIRVLDGHTLDVRFFERGAGVTMSSGTGSTGAAAAAAARGLVNCPVEVQTPAGPLRLRWQGDEILLAGPAEIIGMGEFYWDMTNTTEVK